MEPVRGQEPDRTSIRYVHRLIVSTVGRVSLHRRGRRSTPRATPVMVGRNFSARRPAEVRVQVRYLVAALVSRRYVDLLRVAGAACRS